MLHTARDTDALFRLDAEAIQELVAAYGTPLYVLSEAHLRRRISRYRDAFAAAWPDTELTYASKANGTFAAIRTAYEEGCRIDVASEGELRAAIAAGVPAERCHLHGNAKTRAELEFAVQVGVDQIVVDNFAEIETIHAIGGTLPELVLRLAPGVDPKTHKKISTGQADTKFGFNVADGSAERGLLRALELGLPAVGFHCHVGSQLLDPEAQINGGAILAEFARQMLDRHGFETRVLNVGGGLGVRYGLGDEPMPVERYCGELVSGIRTALHGSDLQPRLVQEPGRSLISEAGVTLYTLMVRKEAPTRTFLSVDGGLSDNPRPALYGARYTVEAPGVEGDTATFTVSGRHCETDMLFPDVELPNAVSEGDVLQVLCTGGYNSSMASNYNRYPRPATAWVRADGSHALAQRRETWDEMFAREMMV